MRLANSDVLAKGGELVRHLLPTQGVEVMDLIHQFPDLFADLPGLTPLVTHNVDVGKALPIKQHPYRLNPEKLAIVREEIAYMLEHGIIEPSSSEWSSPLVLVPKPDGTTRMCVDYRKVNAVSKADSYPIPRIEDCIDRIGSAKYVSKFDLLKGYWQVPLSERAKEISAFVTPDGLYQFRVLPFGLRNAPSCFQRMMNEVTRGLTNCVTYIDDVVLYSDSWTDHVAQIRDFFERLAEAMLVINLSKSEVGRAQVTYLGHVVGQGHVGPRMAKVQAIADLPIPHTRRQLMRVLGMCGFYRKFVSNFAAITEPLTNLLRKSVPYKWTELCQRAFEQVKAVLTCEPVLMAPDFKKTFKLAVDACDVGIGAVLLQEDGAGRDRPVAYYSKKLNRHQRVYSTIEKEALSLVLALQHFEIYVSCGGGDVKIYTDHNPLVFIERFKTKNQRLFRWSLVLQQYNLHIQHVAGKDNIMADTLSRAVG